ncbi:MAG: NAD(P)/FAD-dependent oxidoreductase [Chloroflexota bacterium]|nr:NAD(P)/FAD-dependent oxidoreductase [Chloroflexota bacterium]
MPSRDVDVLLIGGGVASVRCARTLRRRGFAGSVLLVGDERSIPYNRPPLSKELLRGEAPAELTWAEQPEWYTRQRVELSLGVGVVELDVGAARASLADGTLVRFGHCLIATGAAPRVPPVPGAEHALLLRTVVDSQAIHARAVAGKRAVVIGGGFIGVEAAASLAAVGMRVTLLEMASALWAGAFGTALSDWAIGVLNREGVSVRLGTAVSRLEADAAWAGDERLPADLLIAGVGVAPRVDLAKELELDDGIVVDERHRTSAMGVFAAGDVARASGRRVEHWHAAREAGEAAALGMLGLDPPAPRAPWVFTEFARQLVDVVGWAPTFDETVILDGGRLVAYLHDGAVAQLAVVNGVVPVEAARALVESRPRPEALASLTVAAGV